MEDQRYHEISQETVDFVKEVMIELNWLNTIEMEYIHDEKQKRPVEIRKVQPMWQFFIKKELLLIFNEEVFEALNPLQKKILLLQELDRISYNSDNGKIKLVKPDVVTFSKIIDKYGVEDVKNANLLQNSDLKESLKMENNAVAENFVQ